MILSWYFVRQLAKPPSNPKDKLAPKKSISSLKSSFGIEVVPLPSIAPSMVVTPALSPSEIGVRSKARFMLTLGSLWFSTINTFNPFSNVNSKGFLRVISGAGPGSGCLLLSICALRLNDRYRKANNVYNLIFMFSCF